MYTSRIRNSLHVVRYHATVVSFVTMSDQMLLLLLLLAVHHREVAQAMTNERRSAQAHVRRRSARLPAVHSIQRRRSSYVRWLPAGHTHTWRTGRPTSDVSARAAAEADACWTGLTGSTARCPGASSLNTNSIARRQLWPTSAFTGHEPCQRH